MRVCAIRVQAAWRGKMCRRQEATTSKLVVLQRLAQKKGIKLSSLPLETRRQIAAMRIQGQARILLARLRIEEEKRRLWCESKASECIRRAILRKIHRIRGKILLDRMRSEHMQDCAICIESCWRGHVVRRRLRFERRAVRTIERMMIREKQRVRLILMTSAAIECQRMARSLLARVAVRRRQEELHRNACASVVQKAYKRFKARKALGRAKARMMFELLMSRRAAFKIQRWIRVRWRTMAMMRKFRAYMGLRRDAAVTIQSWFHVRVWPWVKRRFDFFAARIQRMVRAHRWRRRVEKYLRRQRLKLAIEWEEWNEWVALNNMAIRVQNCWRARLARKTIALAKQERARRIAQDVIIDRMRSLQNAMRRLEEREMRAAMATRIATAIRGKLARLRYVRKLEQMEKDRQVAAYQLQVAWRAKRQECASTLSGRSVMISLKMRFQVPVFKG